jgi:hypothetical protein
MITARRVQTKAHCGIFFCYQLLGENSWCCCCWQTRPVKTPKGSRAGCVKTTALGYAALKTGSKCSFTTRKLRFFACFCLA